MARRLYSALMWFLLPILLLRLWWRGQKSPGYLYDIKGRFGFGAKPCARVPRIWVHAVSVGETQAAQPLVHALQALRPDIQILVTSTTPTGRDTVRRLFGASVEVAWFPYDYPCAISGFLKHWKPTLGILMETEIWPNLLFISAQQHVPMVLANARLSERSNARYARFDCLFRSCFMRMTCVMAQTEDDANRLKERGSIDVRVCGHIKYDGVIDKKMFEQGRRWRELIGQRPVLLWASTRDGEEEDLLNAHLYSDIPSQVLIIIVPRHPERFDRVTQLAQSFAPTVRRSERLPTLTERFWIGDSMGEMSAYYAMADVAIIGGSLRPYGGQNLIEACAVGCPVILGIHTFNFSDIAHAAVAAGAAHRVDNAGAALQCAVRILQDKTTQRDLSRVSQQFAVSRRGVALDMAQQIIQMMP